MIFWIVIYTHRHGVDVWPFFSDEMPTESEITNNLDDWEGDTREDEYVEVRGPFTVPSIKKTRCGKCKNCKELGEIQVRVMACCNPPFSHADSGVVKVWNTELERLPCLNPTES